MRRVLFDSDGVLRVPVVVALFVLVPGVVLALAAWGGWWGIVGIAIILAASLATMMRVG